jgi:hypothetical protein
VEKKNRRVVVRRRRRERIHYGCWRILFDLKN